MADKHRETKLGIITRLFPLTGRLKHDHDPAARIQAGSLSPFNARSNQCPRNYPRFVREQDACRGILGTHAVRNPLLLIRPRDLTPVNRAWCRDRACNRFDMSRRNPSIDSAIREEFHCNRLTVIHRQPFRAPSRDSRLLSSPLASCGID